MNDQKINVVYLSLVCFVSALGGFLFGYDTAVISGTIGFVKQQFVLSALMEGWFVGSALLGCIIGVAFAGFLSDKFGRKRILILSAVLFAVSALGCAVAQTQLILVFYRLIGGLGVGIASMLSPLYISEISSPELRGRMVTFYQFAITIGILAAYFANALILRISESVLSSGKDGYIRWIFGDEIWRGMFGSELIPAALFFILLFFVPESPRWLTAKKRSVEAEDILTRVSDPIRAKRELFDIEETLKRESGTVRQIFWPGLRIAMFIGISLAILSQLTGINAIIYYGPRIMESAGFKIGDSLNSQVIIGLVNVLFTVIALWKIDQFGRRPLLIAGCGGMMISLFCIGLLFSFGMQEGIALLVFILFYIACFAFSFGPVIWTLLSEIYPTNIRGRAMSIATFSLWTGTFIIGQTVPWLLENMRPAGTFWLFAGMCLPAILITWKLVPETKGKTLEEIERYWVR